MRINQADIFHKRLVVALCLEDVSAECITTFARIHLDPWREYVGFTLKFVSAINSLYLGSSVNHYFYGRMGVVEDIHLEKSLHGLSRRELWFVWHCRWVYVFNQQVKRLKRDISKGIW